MRKKSVSGNTQREVLDERNGYQWTLLKRSFMVCDCGDANSSVSGYNLKTFLQRTFWYFTTICRYVCCNLWGYFNPATIWLL